MTTLSSSGIGSGLDVNGIVTQLMTLENQPLVLLQQKQTSYNSQISAIGQIQSVLAGFQTAAKGLTSATATPAFQTTSSDTSILSASASSFAVAGNYTIGVTQLAQSQKIVAGGVASTTAAIGTGATTTLTIDFGTISGGTYGSGTYSGASFTANAAKTPISVTIDSSNNTLAGIRDAINAENAGVIATIVNDGSGTPYRLVLTSTDSGAVNSLRIEVAGDAALQSLLAYNSAGTQNLSQLQVAQDAHFSVDGIDITKPGNTVTDVVQGVTLNLFKLNTPASIQLSVSQDKSSLTTAINALVAAYNNFNTLITAATAKKAILQGDSTTLTIQRQLRTALGDSITTTSDYKSLPSLHITLQKDGTLAVDSAKLQAVLASNYTDAVALVAAFGASLTTLSDNILATGTGQLANKTAGINAAIKDNSNQQDAFSQRLATIEATYRAQFSALDAMMIGMNQTSSFLQQQFYKTTTSSSGG
ncbi:Flagellar hook-associated protein fliD [Georgfuchsia toluolica]|uniref:Flagellar hook-associated protein 2 n=1 Tax=Georgfuchsia toluolica TaxID=424218 RepID=A0A916J1G3_9PROT|nr:flagellar filament capping protein FliD [Georgfuchsia toluolica]CAG4882208.1 Flagellar hook-associated protein fliD [Georgfuchsia toluolica]